MDGNFAGNSDIIFFAFLLPWYAMTRLATRESVVSVSLALPVEVSVVALPPTTFAF